MPTSIDNEIFIKNGNFPCSSVRNFLRFTPVRPFSHMRRSIPVLCFAAILAIGASLSAQTVTTIPVGFNTAAITPAADANTPKGTVVSIPFYQPAVFVGAVSSVDSSNQISISGANFTSTLTTPPYLAHLKSGASSGRFFIITGNTATQLTLDTATAGYTVTTGSPNNTQAQIVAGDSGRGRASQHVGDAFRDKFRSFPNGFC